MATARISNGLKQAILLMEKEPEMQRRVQRILAAEGVEVRVAQTGARALEIAGQTRLDLVVLGIRLSRASGVEILRRIRKIDKAVPVIMVASNGSAKTVRSAMELGAFDYLTSPFDNQEIRQVALAALASRTDGPIQGRECHGGGPAVAG